MGLFDVHAHLTHQQFLGDLDAVLERARAARVTSIICNGLNLQDNQAVLELSRRESMVRPALGLYPVDAVLREMREANVDYPREGEEHSAEAAIEHLSSHLSEAIAIGEIGLDGYWVPEQFWQRQEEVFVQLLKLAMTAELPVIVHSRKRELRALELLRQWPARGVCWHCFGGKLKLAEEIAQEGHYFSVPCNARRSEGFTRLLQRIPKSQLLLETDCPYLGPNPKERNEPANVQTTLLLAAELWKLPVPETLAIFEQNYLRLFGVMP